MGICDSVSLTQGYQRAGPQAAKKNLLLTFPPRHLVSPQGAAHPENHPGGGGVTALEGPWEEGPGPRAWLCH